MSLLTGWPTLTNDSGDGTSGTVLDQSVFNTIKAQIEDHVHSTSNTGIKPKAITDEVVTARGNKANLNARIVGVIDADGALVTPATIVTASQLQATLGGVNLLKNDTFIMWHTSDTAAPTFWTLSGGSIARTGTGLSDTKRKVGRYAVAQTNAGELYQDIVDAGAWGDSDHLEGKKVSIGCWVWSTIANHVRLQVVDGATTTSSDYHTGASGSGAWEFLTATHSVSASASYLRVQTDRVQNGTPYISGFTAILGDQVPGRHIPSQKNYGMIYFPFSGTPTTGDGKASICLSRPIFIKQVVAYCKAACSGDFTIDVERGDGASSWGSVFSGAQAIINNTYRFGAAVPNGTYANRCVLGGSPDNTATSANNVIRVNFDAINGANDGYIGIRGMQYVNWLEDFVAAADL